MLRGSLKKGFEYPDIKFVLVSESEIFEQKRSRARRQKENTQRIRSYNDINVGDYVVHPAHGIGEYRGTQRMDVGGVSKDYLKIQYRGTDCLYIPVDQLNELYKYIGNSADKTVKLNKLGTQEWNKTKAKVKAATEELARELIVLYAKREQVQGHAFSEDTPWQKDFEDTFEYQETEDQLRSIEEVKEDMEKLKPMDRLLCGDEVWQGAHSGFFQLSRNLRIRYDIPGRNMEIRYRGEELSDEKLLRIGLQKYQYNSFEKYFNFPIQEIEEQHPSKVVSTSARSILEEYLSCHQNLDQELDGRITLIGK